MTDYTYHPVEAATRPPACVCQQCGKPAEVCEYMHWETAGRIGTSYFYYCGPCIHAHIAEREAKEAGAPARKLAYAVRRLREAAAICAEVEQVLSDLDTTARNVYIEVRAAADRTAATADTLARYAARPDQS